MKLASWSILHNESVLLSARGQLHVCMFQFECPPENLVKSLFFLSLSCQARFIATMHSSMVLGILQGKEAIRLNFCPRKCPRRSWATMPRCLVPHLRSCRSCSQDSLSTESLFSKDIGPNIKAASLQMLSRHCSSTLINQSQRPVSCTQTHTRVILPRHQCRPTKTNPCTRCRSHKRLYTKDTLTYIPVRFYGTIAIVQCTLQHSSTHLHGARIFNLFDVQIPTFAGQSSGVCSDHMSKVMYFWAWSSTLPKLRSKREKRATRPE